MLEARNEYWGTELTCSTKDANGLKDLQDIVKILKKNNVLIGGYEESEHEPEVGECKSDDTYYLYLGR